MTIKPPMPPVPFYRLFARNHGRSTSHLRYSTGSLRRFVPRPPAFASSFIVPQFCRSRESPIAQSSVRQVFPGWTPLQARNGDGAELCSSGPSARVSYLADRYYCASSCMRSLRATASSFSWPSTNTAVQPCSGSWAMCCAFGDRRSYEDLLELEALLVVLEPSKS